MPTALDKQLRPVATDLIQQFGKPVLIRRVETSYDAATDEETEVTLESVSTKGVLEGFSTKYLGVQFSITGSPEGSLVHSGDVMVTVPGEAFSADPENGDVLHMGGALSDPRYVVVGVEAIYTGEQVGVYQLHVRRA
jgi:hypothetical protein